MNDPLGIADAVIVAAGASRRMGRVDKLQAPLLGRPLLSWTLDALSSAPSVGRLVVVTAAERVEVLRAEPWIRAQGAVVVAGGERRQASVAAGLAETTAPVVLVHDGARPLVSAALVERVASAAFEHGAAIPVCALDETVKRVAAGIVTGTIDRADLVAAQTPQGARRELLLAAFALHAPDGPREFTDEAALLEAAGIRVVTVPGDATNIKVTTPADIGRVETILAARLGPPRVGQGRDSHPFGPQDGLALGGIVIAEAPRLHGHSDGDVALHALADALLGATGMGDLGRTFAAADPATRGVDSRDLLSEVLRLVASAGWRPAQVDLLIVGARPRFGGVRLDAMRAAIAGLLELAPDAVSVRASSGNLDGPYGAGRSIAAHALVTVARR